MLGPLADINKRPIVFLDSLGAPDIAEAPAVKVGPSLIGDLHRSFNALYVLTSTVVQGRSQEDMLSALEASGLELVACNLHSEWATPTDMDANVAEEVEAWFATSVDRTPSSYLIVANAARGLSLQENGLAEYSVLFCNGFSESDYRKACQILHSQLSFEPFNSDWY